MDKAEKLFEKMAVHPTETMSVPTVKNGRLKWCMDGAIVDGVRLSTIKTAICKRHEKSA